MSARVKWTLGAALVVVLPLAITSCGGPAATRKAVIPPDTGARLARLSIACARRIGELHARKIDGRLQYDKARGAVAEFVGYYAGALDASVDESRTRELLDNVQKETSAFIAWADEQLGGNKAAQPQPLPASEMASELVRFWNENDRGWRQAVAVELKQASFQDWDDVIKRPAGVMP